MNLKKNCCFPILQWKTCRRPFFGSKHKHKNGHSYEVEISGNYIEYKGQEFSCSIVRDLRMKKMEEQLLRIVSEATSGLTGHNFFVELTKNVTRILGMRYAFIVECADELKTRFRCLTGTSSAIKRFRNAENKGGDH